MAPATELQWLSTAELCERLAIGRTHLFKLKSEGVFQPGTHFRLHGSRRMAWDLHAVDHRLRQLAIEA